MLDSGKIKIEIVTPERVVATEEVDSITLPTQEGEITILKGHIPLVSVLVSGVVETKKGEEVGIMAVSGGFVEVLNNKVIVLADTAEYASEIDLDRAEEARERAEQEKQNYTKKEQKMFASVNVQISKNLARTHAVNKWKKLAQNTR
jgi:F-type H+-transporting ATPase subunit epsilon